MSKKITVRTAGSLEEAAKEFIDMWHKVEKEQLPQTQLKKLASKISAI